MRVMRSMLVGGLLLAAIVVAGGVLTAPAAAQDESACEEVQVSRQVEPTQILVGETVYVTITAQSPNCVPEPQPVDIVFLVDRSTTMNADRYIRPTKDAIEAFAERGIYEGGETAIGIITVGDNARTVRRLSSNLDDIKQGITQVRGTQETSIDGIIDGFKDAERMLRAAADEGREQYIIYIGGLDLDDATSFDERISNLDQETASIRNAGVTIAMLMFPDARYSFLIDAASECEWLRCFTWSGQRDEPVRRWAWPVDTPPIGEENDQDIALVLGDWLANMLLLKPSIVAADHFESFSDGVTMVDGSASPPPDLSDPLVPEWDFADFTEDGITITFEVEMEFKPDPYPVSGLSRMRFHLNNGQTFQGDFEPQEVEVLLEPPTATPPPSATPTSPPSLPTEGPTPTPTEGPPPTEPTPTPDGGGAEHSITLPLLYNDHEM